jgi:hypothetical protein
MFNGNREQEQGEAGTSSGGIAEAQLPLYESGLYKNVAGYVKK